MRRRLRHIFIFYRDGFRDMKLGRTLWTVILIKLFVFFVIAKLFFPNPLQERFTTDRERADHVLQHLTTGGNLAGNH